MLFHGRPSTIRSLHFSRSILLVFAIGFSRPSSPFRLFSATRQTNNDNVPSGSPDPRHPSACSPQLDKQRQCSISRGQDYKEKHKTRLKTNVKRTVLNNTVTSFLSTDCELSTNPCSKNVYNLGPRPRNSFFWW